MNYFSYLIELLQESGKLEGSDVVDIARGRHAFPRNWKELIEKSKNQ